MFKCINTKQVHHHKTYINKKTSNLESEPLQEGKETEREKVK